MNEILLCPCNFKDKKTLEVAVNASLGLWRNYKTEHIHLKCYFKLCKMFNKLTLTDEEEWAEVKRCVGHNELLL